MESSLPLVVSSVFLSLVVIAFMGARSLRAQEVEAKSKSKPASTVGETRIVHIDFDAWWEGDKKLAPAHNPYLIVGKHSGFELKRSLMDVDQAEMEAALNKCSEITSATFHLYFLYAHKASWIEEDWIPRDIVVEGIRKPFRHCLSSSKSCKWPKNFVDDPEYTTDIKSTPIHVPADIPAQWFEWDITAIARDWIERPDEMRGLVAYALNEDEDGRDLRFASERHSDSDLWPLDGYELEIILPLDYDDFDKSVIELAVRETVARVIDPGSIMDINIRPGSVIVTILFSTKNARNVVHDAVHSGSFVLVIPNPNQLTTPTATQSISDGKQLNLSEAAIAGITVGAFVVGAAVAAVIQRKKRSVSTETAPMKWHDTAGQSAFANPAYDKIPCESHTYDRLNCLPVRDLSDYKQGNNTQGSSIYFDPFPENTAVSQGDKSTDPDYIDVSQP
eukprot:gene5900-9085_t